MVNSILQALALYLTLVAGEDPEPEPEEEQPRWKIGAVSLGLITFLVIFSVIWEGTVGTLERCIDPEMMPILKALFAELTLMGFIGLLLFIIAKTPILKLASVQIFGEGDENATRLQEQFETIHMVIFLVMSVFFFEIVLILAGGNRLTALYDQVQDEVVDYNRTAQAKFRVAKQEGGGGGAAGAGETDGDGNTRMAQISAEGDLEADGHIVHEPLSAHEDPHHVYWNAPQHKHVRMTLESELVVIPYGRPEKMTAVNAYADRYRRTRGMGLGANAAAWLPVGFPASIMPSPVLWCPQCILQPDGTDISESNDYTPDGICAKPWTRFQFEFSSIRRRFISVPIDSTAKGIISKEFDFADYMTSRFAWVGAEIIEVSVRSWILLWVIITIIWAVVFTQDMFVNMWVFIAFFYFFLLAAIPVVQRQFWLYSMVIPVHYPLALAHHHTFPCGKRTKPLASSAPATSQYTKMETHSDHDHGHKQHHHSEEEEEEGMAACMKQFLCYAFDCPVPGGPFAACPIRAMRPCCACGAEEEEGHGEHHEGHAPFMSLFVGGHVGAHGLMKVVRIWMLLVAIYIAAISILGIGANYESLVVQGESGGVYMFVAMVVVAIIPIPIFMLIIFHMITLLALTVSIESFRAEKEKGGCRDQIERVELHLLTMKAVGMIKTIQRLQMSINTVPDTEGGGAARKPIKELSRAQKRKHKQLKRQIDSLFERVDLDNSGTIDGEELAGIFKTLGFGMDENDDCVDLAMQVITSVDVPVEGEEGGGDGVITADELLAYLVSVQPSAANVEGMVEKLFALIDDDNSGAISSGELHSFLVEKLGWSPSTLSIEDVEKIIDEIDDDGDDHISQAELKAFLIKHSR